MITKQVLAFLQNAWSPLYAGETWPRELWLKALARSRSGTRLKHLTAECPTAIIHWDNTTPQVGATANSVIPADESHIRSVLEAVAPDFTLALGRQATEALLKLQQQPLLILPHPTYRPVTNQLYQQAGQLINNGFQGIIELKQRRGFVETIHHTGY